jgi:hypothetical protein
LANFDFIRTDEIYLHTLGEQAERLCLIDPDAAFTKLRKFGEMLARIVAKEADVDVSMATPIEVLQELDRRRVLSQPQLRSFHRLRIMGNSAAHPDHDGDSEEAVRRLPTEDEAIEQLAVAHELAEWFHTRKGGRPPVAAFCPPSAPRETGPSETAGFVEFLTDRQPASQMGPPGPGLEGRSQPVLAAEEGSPDERVNQLCRESIAKARALHEDVSAIERACEAGRALMEAARAPFRLGIVGEFRSGKSTLINGLLGIDIAPRGAAETTSWICRYGRGQGGEARLLFQNGRVERVSNEEANRRLLLGRRDAAWLATLDRAEFDARSSEDLPFDLWDAPGLGGRDDNELLANRFIDSIAGAIWVFDPSFLGSATVVAPLQKLRAAGKRILGVINRADTLSPGDLEDASAFVRENYSQFLDDVCATSALEMLANNGKGKALREDLLGHIRRVILSTAESDRARRVDRAIGACARGVADAVRKVETKTRNRIGLVHHTRANFARAAERTLKPVARYIEEAVETAFAGEWRAAREEVAELFQSGKGTERRVGALLEDFDAACSLRAAWPLAVSQVLHQVEADWLCHGHAAVKVTKATVEEPVSLDQVGRVPIDLKVEVDSETSAKVGRTERDWGLASAFGLSALAAASAAISWPIVLAAIPIGLLAGRVHAEKLTAEPRLDIADSNAALDAVVKSKRVHLGTALKDELPDAARAVLESELDRYLGRFSSEQLFGHSLAEFEGLAAALTESRRMLEARAGLLIEGDAGTDYATQDDFEVPNGAQAAKVLGALVGGAASRVDIATASPDAELRELLLQIRPGTAVRWLTTCRRDEIGDVAELVRRRLAGWKGEALCRVVWKGDGTSVPLNELEVISEHGAWVCKDLTHQIGLVTTKWMRHPFGQLAASRVFAEFWTGVSLEYGELQVRTI